MEHDTETVKRVEQLENPQLKIDIEPIKLMLTSNPYVVFSKRGYQVVIDVMDLKKKRQHFIYISSFSLSQQIENLRLENGGAFIGIEFWIWKAGPEKFSKYIVEE